MKRNVYYDWIFFQIGFDDCSSNPCPFGTVCLDTRDGFSCICPPWQGDCTYGKSTSPPALGYLIIVFILAFNVGCTCKNGGRCMMGLGTYICECPYGYAGVNCETSKSHVFSSIHTIVRNSFCSYIDKL